MHFPSLFSIVLLALISSVCATTCHQDNCYRALQNRPTAATSFCRFFTTSTMPVPTATPPPFANQCEWSPHRINSACSCLVPKVTTTSGPCEPTPAMDVARNGGFDQVAISSVGVAIPSMKPWSWEKMRGATGDFVREGPGIYFGEGAAAWHIEGLHPPAAPNGGYLSAPISVCSGRTYTVSLYARKTSASGNQYLPQCTLSISTLLAGDLGAWNVVTPEFEAPGFAGWSYTPTVEPVVNGVGREGSVYALRGEPWDGRGWEGWGWNDTLRIGVFCEAQDAPLNVLVEVDSVRIT